MDAVLIMVVTTTLELAPTVMVVPLGGLKAPGGSVAVQPATLAGPKVQM